MRHEGWHRALDVQLDLHKWSTLSYGERFHAGVFEAMVTHSGPGSPIDEDMFNMGKDLASHITRTLWRADTIFVTSEMLHLLMQASHDLPADAIVDTRALLSNNGFVLFEEALDGVDRNGVSHGVNALLWECGLRRDTDTLGMIVYFFTDPYDPTDYYGPDLVKSIRDAGLLVPPLAFSHMYPISDGNILPQDDGTTGKLLVSETVKLFWALQLLSHQTIGEPVKVLPTRAQRRRIDREYKESPERMLTLITLRRRSVKNDEPQSEVPWTRRWVVRGHWRKQWYPSLKLHQYKYIHEYIKGPEDKPLVTGRRVFNFRR